MKARSGTTLAHALLLLMLAMLPTPLPAGEAAVVPPPGKAMVVVYRPAKIPGVLLQSNESYHIAYDSQWISTVARGRHFVFPAWPGAHVIQPAIGFTRMAENDKHGSSTVRLDVKAGETYYIKATPSDTTHIVSGAGNIALALVDKDMAEKELAESKPVDWAKDLVDGTLAEVQPLGSQPDSMGPGCDPVEWTPDMDSIKTPPFKRSSILNGRILMQNDSVLLLLKQGSDAAPAGVTIPYADIASVEIRNKVLKRIVVIARKNGRLDSFSVSTAGGGRIDRDQTAACGEQLAGKVH